MERIWQNGPSPSLSYTQDHSAFPSFLPSAEQSYKTKVHHEDEEVCKETEEEWQIEMEKICADIEGELTMDTTNSTGDKEQHTTAFLHAQSELICSHLLDKQPNQTLASIFSFFWPLLIGSVYQI